MYLKKFLPGCVIFEANSLGLFFQYQNLIFLNPQSKDRIEKDLISASFLYHNVTTGPAILEDPGATATPLFCFAKRKRGNKGKKVRLSKQKLLKDCHQGQNVNVLAILERLEFKNSSGLPTKVSVFHGPSTLKSISPALNNQFSNLS